MSTIFSQWLIFLFTWHVAVHNVRPAANVCTSPAGGRTEPIRPEVRQGRAGLGRQAALRAVEQRKQEIRARAAERRERATCAVEFRRRQRDKMSDRYLTADLMKSQRVCQQLDTKLVSSVDGRVCLRCRTLLNVCLRS